MVPVSKCKDIGHQDTMMTSWGYLLVMEVVGSRDFDPLQSSMDKHRSLSGRWLRSAVHLSWVTWGQSTVQCPSRWHFGNDLDGLQGSGQNCSQWPCWPHLKQQLGGSWAFEFQEAWTVPGAGHTTFASMWYFSLLAFSSLRVHFKGQCLTFYLWN